MCLCTCTLCAWVSVFVYVYICVHTRSSYHLAFFIFNQLKQSIHSHTCFGTGWGGGRSGNTCVSPSGQPTSPTLAASAICLQRAFSFETTKLKSPLRSRLPPSRSEKPKQPRGR